MEGVSGQDRPDQGIDEASIERLVRRFYGRARVDPMIGPVFEAAITDWEPHIVRIVDFWSSMMLGTGRYKGSPFAAHMPLPIAPAFFDRWLALWRETTAELFAPEAAEVFNGRAERIAESLKLGLALRAGGVIAERP